MGMTLQPEGQKYTDKADKTTPKSKPIAYKGHQSRAFGYSGQCLGEELMPVSLLLYISVSGITMRIRSDFHRYSTLTAVEVSTHQSQSNPAQTASASHRPPRSAGAIPTVHPRLAPLAPFAPPALLERAPGESPANSPRGRSHRPAAPPHGTERDSPSRRRPCCIRASRCGRARSRRRDPRCPGGKPNSPCRVRVAGEAVL